MLKSVLLPLILVCSGSHQQCFTKYQQVRRSHREAWITSYHNFSVSLMKALSKAVNKEDVFFSPIAIHEGLLLAYFGSKRKTESMLTRVLQIPKRQSKTITWKLYHERKFYRRKYGGEKYPLKIANKIYLSDQLRLYGCMKIIFNEELEQIDFANFFHAERVIKEWVEQKADVTIANKLKGVSPLSTAALVNIANFKGKWEKGFNEYMTVLLPFRVSELETTFIDMMYQFDFFHERYSHELRARLLLLPYEGKQIAMIVLLPDEDLDSMIESMNQYTIQDVTDRGRYKSSYISIFIPRFTYVKNTSMYDALNMLGIGSNFTKFADFSRFTGRKEVFFDSFNHIAAIEVTEAGANPVPTMGFPYLSSMMELHEDFLCDRPFAFIIYDYSAKATIFMGIFRNPQPLQANLQEAKFASRKENKLGKDMEEQQESLALV